MDLSPDLTGFLNLKWFNRKVFPDAYSLFVAYLVKSFLCTPVNITMVSSFIGFPCYLLFPVKKLECDCCNVAAHIFKIYAHFCVDAQDHCSQFMGMRYADES